MGPRPPARAHSCSPALASATVHTDRSPQTKFLVWFGPPWLAHGALAYLPAIERPSRTQWASQSPGARKGLHGGPAARACRPAAYPRAVARWGLPHGPGRTRPPSPSGTPARWVPSQHSRTLTLGDDHAVLHFSAAPIVRQRLVRGGALRGPTATCPPGMAGQAHGLRLAPPNPNTDAGRSARKDPPPPKIQTPPPPLVPPAPPATT